MRTLLSASSLSHELLFTSTIFSSPNWSELEQGSRHKHHGSNGNHQNPGSPGTSTSVADTNGSEQPLDGYGQKHRTIAPSITSADSATFTVGKNSFFTVNAQGSPVPTLAETGTLPNGVSFNASTGLLSGTPSAGSGGTYDLTFTATNGVNPNASQSFVLTVKEAPTITSDNAATFSVGSDGTFTVSANGFPTPNFREMGALPAGVSFNSSTDMLSGTPQTGTGGTYPIVFIAVNGVGPAATQNFTLTVDTAPAITSANATTFAVGTAGSFTVTASGYPSPTFTETGALPNGVAFNDSTGVLSGMPSTGTGGIYDLTFTASNGVSPDATQSFILTVDEGSTITSPNSTTFTVGAAGTFTVTAGGFPAATFGETGALPNGVSFNSATGVLTGTPQPGTGGVYDLTISASNGIITDPSQSFTLIVDEVPEITSTTTTTFTVGQSDTFTVTANGYPPATLVESGALPSGVGFNTATGVLSGAPQPGTGGTYDLTFTPINSTGTGNAQTFTLIVNESPAITSASGTIFTVGTAGTFTVTTNGFPTSTIAETGTLPAGVFFNASSGVLSGTPQLGSGGTYDLTFTPANLVGTGATQDFTLIVNQAPTITSPNGALFTVGTAGNFDVTATGTPGVTFGETGALPAGVTFDTATGALAGTPQAGTGGTFDLTFTATNGVTPDATQSFVLLVNQAPAITSSNGAIFTVGAAGTFTATATGFPAPSFEETGALPMGVTFNDATGTLSGTPLFGSGGTYPLTITATNGVDPDATQSFSLIVVNAPVITSANSATFVVGTAGTFDVTAAGVPAPQLGETGALPTGLSFDAATGVLSGTPATGTGGTSTLTFTATNGESPDASQTFTLVIDEAPAITTANSATFTVGTAGTFDLAATGFPAPTFNEAGALPNGLSFSPTGVLTGTPLPGAGGLYSVTFTPVNSVAVGPGQIFTIVVLEDPPITSANSTTFTVGTAGDFTVTASGYPASTFAETGNLPAGVSFNSSTGLLSGTPLANTGGPFDLTFTATNLVGTGPTQDFTLIVDQAPVVSSVNTTTFTVGASGTFDVTVSGFPAATFGETGALPSGVFFNAATGVLSGTPAPGSAGVYPLTITATNGVAPDASQTFTLNVDLAPTITSGNSATFVVGTAATFDVTANGFPAPTLSESGALPSGVTFNPATDELTGTPATGTGGPFTVTFTATNGVSPDATQTFTLTVDEAPAITSVNGALFTVGTAGTFDLTATGFPAPTFNIAGTLPNGLTFSPTGVLSGTPLAGTGGPDTVTFTPVNSVGVGNGQIFTITVDESPTITSDATTVFAVGTLGTFDVTANGFPNPTFAETGALPAGVSFNSSTGVLNGTPLPTTGGSYPLTITPTNTAGTGPSQNFTLVVDQTPAITSVNTTTFTVGTNGSFTVTASGYPAPSIMEAAPMLPLGVGFNSSTGVLSGTPSQGTGGTYTIDFTPQSIAGSGPTQTFTLIVNQAPAFASANTTVFTVGTAGSFTVTASGYPAPTLSESGPLPTGVSLNPTTGVLSGTPQTGTGGSFPVTITATNGVSPVATETFTLLVNQVPQITSANSTDFTVGTNGSFQLTATGFPAATFSVSETLPPGLSFNSAGLLTGTPLAGTGNTYTLHFQATNSAGSSAFQTFTLIILQAPAITSPNAATFTVEDFGSFNVTSTGYPAATYEESGALPDGVTFNDTTGVFSGTPAIGSDGTYTITITAMNGVDTNAMQTLTLLVNP